MLQLLQNFFGTSKVPKLFKNFFTICENFSKLFHNFAKFFCELFVKLFYKLFRNFFAKLSPNFVKKWSLFLQLFATFLINFFDQILSTFLIDFLQEIDQLSTPKLSTFLPRKLSTFLPPDPPPNTPQNPLQTPLPDPDFPLPGGSKVATFWKVHPPRNSVRENPVSYRQTGLGA